MYIRKLIIQETHPTKKIIRSIPFTLGLNLIVDDSKHSGNNVGKTTVLRIIDICLGEKEKSSIYTDQETNLVNIPLKTLFKMPPINTIDINNIVKPLKPFICSFPYNINDSKKVSNFIHLSLTPLISKSHFT